MRLDAPRCPRCEGEQFLRVRNVMDAAERAASVEWHRRPVGRRGRSAVGHFETLICRGCGHTTWFAFDWLEADGTVRVAYCDGCEREVEHRSLPAIEHTPQGLCQAKIVRGNLSWEGGLELSICRPCGLTSWEGSGLAALEYTHRGQKHRLVDGEAACRRCHATRLILVDAAEEIAGSSRSAAPIAVAVVEARALRFICYASRRGRYALQICRACKAVDWLARDLDQVKLDPAQGIEAVGARPTGERGGPYR